MSASQEVLVEAGLEVLRSLVVLRKAFGSLVTIIYCVSSCLSQDICCVDRLAHILKRRLIHEILLILRGRLQF